VLIIRYFIYLEPDVLLPLYFCAGLLGAQAEFFEEFIMEVVVGSFTDVEGAIKFSDDI
jgi:hypothetical protein